MAEKNTLSILETIKKKLHKFDQKTEKNNKISEVSAEFEYISPTKKPADVANVEIKSEEKKNSDVVQNTLPKFEDDLGLEELSEPEEKVKEIASAVVPATQTKLDDFNLDDLDLDDESAIVKKPEISQTVESHAEATEEDFIEEDHEGQVDLNEETEIEKKITEEKNPTESDDLDLNFEEEEEEKETPVVEATPQEEPAAEDELDLNFEEEEEEKETAKIETPIVEAKPQEEPVKKDDDDLNFDDLELEEVEQATSEKQSPPIVELAKNEDVDLGELDEALAQQEATKKGKKTLSLDEIDLEFEKEIMGFRPEAASPTTTNQPVTTPPEVITPPAQPVVEVVVTPEVAQPVVEVVVTPEVITPPAQPVVEVVVTPEVAQPVVEVVAVAPPEVITPPAQPVVVEVITQAPQESAIQQIAVQDFASISNQTIHEEKAASSIISDTTIMRTTESIKKLIDAKNVVTGISSFAQSPAFAELAIQLMEPKLERWLNENLPEVVEKIVREEIKKIIPKE